MLSYFLSAILGGAVVVGTGGLVLRGQLDKQGDQITALLKNHQDLDDRVFNNQRDIVLNLNDITKNTTNIDERVKALDERITVIDENAAKKTGLMLQPVAKALVEVRQVVGLS